MAERDRALLLDIIDYAERISAQTGRLTLAEFAANPDAEDATAYRLLAIGEACGKLSDAIKMRHPQLPWKQIRGLRNVVAHDYSGRESATVWDTIQVSLPLLLAMAEQERDRLNQEAEG